MADTPTLEATDEADFPPPPPELYESDSGTYDLHTDEEKASIQDGESLDSRTESDQDEADRLDTSIISANDQIFQQKYQNRAQDGYLTIERAIKQLEIYQEGKLQCVESMENSSSENQVKDIGKNASKMSEPDSRNARKSASSGPGMFYQRAATSSVQIAKHNSVKNLRAQFEKNKIIFAPKIEEPIEKADEPKPVYV